MLFGIGDFLPVSTIFLFKVIWRSYDLALSRFLPLGQSRAPDFGTHAFSIEKAYCGKSTEQIESLGLGEIEEENVSKRILFCQPAFKIDPLRQDIFLVKNSPFCVTGSYIYVWSAAGLLPHP